jgi:hypothetical protein
MKRVVFSLATLLIAAACTDQRTSPSASHAFGPNGRSNAAAAAVAAVGGPLASGDCTRSTGKPVEVSFPFSATDGGSATLTVIDNGVQGLNGTITLNGVEVVTHPMLGGNGPVSLSIPVTTAADNVLVCKLEGKPGSGLSFQVQ